MALWRTKLKLSYETWHLTHIVLAVVAVDGGHRCTWSAGASTSVDPWKRGAVDRPDDLLDRAARSTCASSSRCSCSAGRTASSEVRKERGDTWTLVMQPDGHAGFRFRPGQFGWLTVWGSPFKITGAPVLVLVERGGARRRASRCRSASWATSRARFDKVPVGRRVYLDGPYGAFTIGNPADMHVLIAGGVGITPMMSMIRTLADQGDKRPVILLYGSKDWESITFREELEALKARLDLTVVHVLANPPEGWTGERGFITAEVFKRHLPPPYADHEYFICGPGVMMDAIENALGELNVPMSKYHSERYSFV